MAWVRKDKNKFLVSHLLLETLMSAEATKVRLTAEQRLVRDNQAEADKLIDKNEASRKKVRDALQESRELVRQNYLKLKLMKDLIEASNGIPSDSLVEELKTAEDEAAAEAL